MFLARSNHKVWASALLLLVQFVTSSAFHLSPDTPRLAIRSSCPQATILYATRRTVLENASTSVTAAIFAATISFWSIENAAASGGATAGGAYLLSAKQRYNSRVTKGVTGFVGLNNALEKNDIDAVRAFFSSEDEGAWKDFTAAGYLLANAFRTNSSAAPDSLPSVKKWKAFTAQVELMTNALKKKDTAAAILAHSSSVVALDEYLTKVDLPTSK